MKSIHNILLPILLLGAGASAAPLDMKAISSLTLAGSEISAFDPTSKRIFVTSDSGLQIVDLSDPANPMLIATVDFTDHGLSSTDVTSVSVHSGKVAVAIPAPVKSDPGRVAFLNAADGAFLGSVEVGVLPDHVIFTPDGSKVLTADEGEMLTDGTDPAPGTVTIIDVSDGFESPATITVDFTAFDAQAVDLKAAGVRIFEDGDGNLKLPSLDFEPEYLAISPDSAKALVTLQEANAVALLDIASATFTAVVPLGEKDFSPLLADFSDRDGPGGSTAIKLARGNPVFGLYMPDAIASFTASGRTYYAIANEGDDRDDFMPETIRVGSAAYELDPEIFPNAAELKDSAVLGRLTVSNSPGLRGDDDNDGKIDRILAYGGRSFSILDENGAIVYDSGDLIERATANFGEPWFDDTRSDNKAAEPEGIVTGIVDGRTYAFVGLERSRSVIVFDVTDPADVSPAGFATRVEDGEPVDLNPEGLTFIAPSDSPNGKALLVVTNEVSNTLTVFTVEPAAYTLQLLHLADAEAGLLAPQTAPRLAALVDAFDGEFDNTLILAGGDNFIPSPFLNAGTDPSLSAVPGIGATAFARPDIAIHNAIGVEASTIGNHEWDLGSDVFAGAIRPAGAWVGAQFPHISLNLEFSGDSSSALRGAFDDVPLDGTATAVPEASDLKGRIVPTAVIIKGGEKIGLVGVTTQLIETISSPSGTRVKGNPGGDDIDLLASQVQPYIDELEAEGVNKIILLSHLQQLTNERALATKLSGVDIILAAGSNTRLGDADDVPAAFPGHGADFADSYPVRTSGLDGDPVLIVNTDNEFTYLGRLVVDFDENGAVIVPNLAIRSLVNGAYASTAENVAAAWNVAVEDLQTTAFAAGTKGAAVKAISDAVQAVINAKDGEVFGFTLVYLEGERSFVRSQETNLGNITADANAAALRAITGSTAPIVSLKNGGGIRAQIGAVSSQGGGAEKLPPPANPAVGKLEGGVSRLDIENALRFDNKLIAFETTPEGLKAILEHGIAAWPNQGRFPQVGGVSFSWDPALPAGSRIRAISLIDDNSDPAAAVYKDGELIASAPASIAVVTLNFLANNGDGYPIKQNGENFRYLLTDDTLGPVLDEEDDFTVAPSLPANPVGEQQVFGDYLAARYGTPESAYATADTPAAADLRIQKLDVRDDEVLPYSLVELATLNDYAASLRLLGLSPLLAITMPETVTGIEALRTEGRAEVLANPGGFNLYTAESIQDLRGSGMLIQVIGENVELRLPIERSDSLSGWESAGEMSATLPKIGDRAFYRLTLPE